MSWGFLKAPQDQRDSRLTKSNDLLVCRVKDHAVQHGFNSGVLLPSVRQLGEDSFDLNGRTERNKLWLDVMDGGL
jgi:hypothetical protein